MTIKKTIHADKRRILRKYNTRIILLNLPSIAAGLASLAIVALLYLIGTDAINIPDVIYSTIIYALYFSVAYSFIVCLIGSIISDVLLKAHTEHTYIEIADSLLVISQHDQTVFTEGKFQSYKKLWIIDLKEVEEVECIKNHLIITANARYFNEKADWLHYEKGENGVDFDNWWYNNNGGKLVQSVEITDFYTYGERIAKRIMFCSKKAIAQAERRERFRREMLDIAKNTKHRRGISEKYKEPKYRTFR